MAQTVKRLPTMQEAQVRYLGQEDPLEKEMATHSSTLAWKIPWMKEPGSPWGCKESHTTERLHFHFHLLHVNLTQTSQNNSMGRGKLLKLLPPLHGLNQPAGCSPHMCMCVQSLSHVRLFATLWTVAHRAPLSMGSPRQEYWSGLPFPSPGDLPDPGIKPGSPPLQADSLPSESPGKPALHFSSTSLVPSLGLHGRQPF